MLDTNKRTTLKIIGGATAIAAAPSMVMAGINHQHGAADEIHPAQKTELNKELLTAGTSITIALLLDPEPILRMTNHSNQLVIVRHVSPGILHAGDQVFDINSVFERCAYAISAGTSRNVKISPSGSSPVQTDVPKHLQHRQQHLLAVTGRDRTGKLANSSQHFFV